MTESQGGELHTPSDILRRLSVEPSPGLLEALLDLNNRGDSEGNGDTANRIILDALLAFYVLQPADSAGPWNAAGEFMAAGRNEAAALLFLTAAANFDKEAENGSGLTGDESDWAADARRHAFDALVDAGLLASAAILLAQLSAEEQARARDQLMRLLADSCG